LSAHESQDALRRVEALGHTAVPPWLTDEAVERVRRVEHPPFPPEEYEERLARVRQRMGAIEVDALIVFRPSNIEYLTGYHTEETAPQPLVVTANATSLYVPDLEVGRALVSATVDEIYFCSYTDALQGIREYLDHLHSTLGPHPRVGLERADSTTPMIAIDILLENGAAIVDSNRLVERERLVLSARELSCVERAAAITARGQVAGIEAAGRAEATEASIAAAVSEALLRAADSASAWGPVVVAGPRAGVPHSSFQPRGVGDSPVFLEFSGTHRRYHAPVMRTLIKRPVSGREKQLVELSQAIVQAVLENARPGMRASTVAKIAREAIEPLPPDVVFHQLFGYPIGLAHKPHWMDGFPFHIADTNTEELHSGMVFHIPASLRVFGEMCIGISQTFTIEPGGARVLTHGVTDIITV